MLLAGVGGRQVREELWVLSGRPVPFFQLKQKPGTGTSPFLFFYFLLLLLFIYLFIYLLFFFFTSPFLDVASLPEVFQASDTA